MKVVSLKFAALVFSSALLGACSTTSSAEKSADIGDVPGGGGDRRDAGNPLPDGAVEDADTEDASDLVPLDASRGEQDGGDGGESDVDADEPFDPECVFAEDCIGKVPLGTCEVPVCNEHKCIKTLAKIGMSCDDGDPCTDGDLCDGSGTCHGGALNTELPECADTLAQNAVWITEIMGNPKPIGGMVDELEGQWIELASRKGKPVSMEKARLVYYEWNVGENEPVEPANAVRAHVSDFLTIPPGESVVAARSVDPDLNGSLPTGMLFNEISFSKNRNARLILVGPNWKPDREKPFPIPPEHIIDSVYIPAGTFDDSQRGQSWQASTPLPDSSKPSERQWCHTPVAAANVYVEKGAAKNYGTPGQSNTSCAP